MSTVFIAELQIHLKTKGLYKHYDAYELWSIQSSKVLKKLKRSQPVEYWDPFGPVVPTPDPNTNDKWMTLLLGLQQW